MKKQAVNERSITSDLQQLVGDFLAVALIATTDADFAESRRRYRKIGYQIDKMQKEAARSRIKKRVDRQHGRTDRHEMVARKVLLEGFQLKEAGELIGVTGVRVRQLINEFCRGRNREVFDFEFHRSPTLKQLRYNATKFFG